MIRYASDILPDFEYFVKGDNPTLLIHSGTHGDEFEIIDLIKEAVIKYENKLPDFIFVPIVSPSAVKFKNRFNNNGSDINRIFFPDSKDLEVVENIKIIKDYQFELMVSFHEDPDQINYYVYDEGTNPAETKLVLKHNQILQNIGINLLNGMDDSEDPALGIEFTEGYRKFILTKGMTTNNGMVTSWAISNDIAKDTLVPEIPGKADLKSKQYIIDTFFSEILIKY